MGSRFAGLGAQGQQQALLDVGQENSANTANFLNESSFNELIGNRDFARGTLGRERGFEFESQEREKDREEERRRARGRGLGSLGRLAGGIGASFIPGIGPAAGAAILGGGG